MKWRYVKITKIILDEKENKVKMTKDKARSTRCRQNKFIWAKNNQRSPNNNENINN